MVPKQSPNKMATIAEPEIKTKPVRVDLLPVVNKALRREAADQDRSTTALARKIISEHLGFKDEGGGK